MLLFLPNIKWLYTWYFLLLLTIFLIGVPRKICISISHALLFKFQCKKNCLELTNILKSANKMCSEDRIFRLSKWIFVTFNSNWYNCTKQILYVNMTCMYKTSAENWINLFLHKYCNYFNIYPLFTINLNHIQKA